jgi:hypothetical protein
VGVVPRDTGCNVAEDGQEPRPVRKNFENLLETNGVARKPDTIQLTEARKKQPNAAKAREA